MKRIIIELADEYANVLSITAVGTGKYGEGLYVATNAMSLSQHTYCKIDENGKVSVDK
jgi:hypothetical protein